MNLQERLQVLIGHEVMVHLRGDPLDDEGYTIGDVPLGTLREVGDNWFIIETKSKEDGGLVEGNGAEWQVPIQVEAPDAESLVLLHYVTSILHIYRGCAGCAIDTASEKLEVEGG